MLHALIMAGGSGTRLWPLSRRNRPKQSLPLTGDRSMFQITVDRVLPLIPPERVHVVTNAEMARIFREQTPQIPLENYIIEPAPKDSGPAVGLGVAHICRRDPDATLAVLSADHYIGRTDEFRRVLESAHELAGEGGIVTLGIRPTYPATGYGYIERGESLGVRRYHEAFRALRFREKPDQATAEAWFRDSRFSWNSGMFIMTCQTAWREFERQMPEFAAGLREIECAVGAARYAVVLDNVWQAAPRISLDYALMEGAQQLAVIPVDIDWADIGSWASVMQVMPPDAHGNVVIGDHVGLDTERTLVHAESRLVATIGVRNLAIIDTTDAVLICPLERAQEVKALVEALKRAGREDVL
ncbi:MAG: mannose-1-phosphate guanylyltransferase [Anaerolineae bacterium]|nr:sugar phosphate nucleotidyltransferase [Thermoflexales bacterium]MDW8406995.1 mannose-1-phosphate guanylyltransferase [Anaerolineae bacterium]